MAMAESFNSNNSQDVKQARELDGQGFIPSPTDTLDDLKQRVANAQKFQAHIRNEFSKKNHYELIGIHYVPEDMVPSETLMQCLGSAHETYGIKPSWVPAFFHNKGLNILYGGMAWGVTDSEGLVAKDANFSVFQLRKGFQHKSKLLLYTREELISHESCHIARMELNAIEYEELLAYRFSPSRFRRHFGTLLNHRGQMGLFLIAMLLFIASQILFVNGFDHPLIFWGMKVPFFLGIPWLLFQNEKRHRTFNRALKKLAMCYGDDALKVAFRLNDREINAIAKLPFQADLVEQFIASNLSDLRQAIIGQWRDL